MQDYQLIIAARIVHVLAVVAWIGGVAFITTVLIPALIATAEPERRLAQFEELEGRFGRQAKGTTLLVGLSGLYMLHALNAWERYLLPAYCWLHLMTLVWLIFTLVLFVLEPLFLHRWFRARALRDSAGTFRLVHRLHVVLLALSLIAVLGGVAGAHGF